MSVYIPITRTGLGLLTSRFMLACCMIVLYLVPRKIVEVIQASLVCSTGMSHPRSVSILVADQPSHCSVIHTEETI